MKRFPDTPATRFLSSHGVAFEGRAYDYVEHGGTAESARQLGVDEHCVVKTIVLENESFKPLVALLCGDQRIALKDLAAAAAARSCRPCAPETAQKHSGYLVGGTSPFGMRKSMPIYVDEAVLRLPAIYINGGRRGFLVHMKTADLVRLIEPRVASIALPK